MGIVGHLEKFSCKFHTGLFHVRLMDFRHPFGHHLSYIKMGVKNFVHPRVADLKLVRLFLNSDPPVFRNQVLHPLHAFLSNGRFWPPVLVPFVAKFLP